MAYTDDSSMLDRVKTATLDELRKLAAEIRAHIKEVTSVNGGHLGAPLGAVEVALAVHSVFESPHDRIVWDTGHQAYAHKIITGRAAQLERLRQRDGASGFPSPAESRHDAFGTGHASTGIAAGCGLAAAKPDSGRWVIVVIGDAALAGGPALEALLLAKRLAPRMCIVVNDNDFSIMPSVAPFTQLSDSVRNLATAAGLPYVGPLDGHSLPQLREQLVAVRERGVSTVFHVRTVKGEGHAAAVDHPLRLHAIEATGTAVHGNRRSFQTVLLTVVKEALENGAPLKLITAAMGAGLGMQDLMRCYPRHCFDVGIAEATAATFAAAVSLAQFPVVLHMYSTFLMRCSDQLIHDVGLHACALTLLVDRVGLAGAEGPTHHGIYDLAVLTAVPGATIYSASSPARAAHLFKRSLARSSGLCAIRIPKGDAPNGLDLEDDSIPDHYVHRSGDDLVIISYGRLIGNALAAAEELGRCGVSAQVTELLHLYPLSGVDVCQIAGKNRPVLFVEEHVESGSIGLHFLGQLCRASAAAWTHLCIRNPTAGHATLVEQWDMVGLSVRHIVTAAETLIGTGRPMAPAEVEWR